MGHFLFDMMQTVRALRKSPGFTLVVVLILVIGIGANAAVFYLIDTVLFQQLRVPRPGELYNVIGSTPSGDVPLFSYPDYRAMRSVLGATGDLAAFGTPTRETLVIGDRAMPIWIQMVSSNFFRTLRVEPFVGRLFGHADDVRRSPVVVLSRTLADRLFGNSRAAIGRILQIKSHQFIVLGVVPSGNIGIEPGLKVDLWLPISSQALIGYTGLANLDQGADWKRPWLEQASISWLKLVARSPNDKNGHHLSAMLNGYLRRTLADQIRRTTDEGQREMMSRVRLLAEPAGRGIGGARQKFSLVLWTLAGLVGLLLLSCCSNVTMLLLLRIAGRNHEFALQAALGASPYHLVRQVLMEGFGLCLLAGLISIPVARTGAEVIIHAVSNADAAIAINLRTDWKVFAFLFASCCCTALAAWGFAASRLTTMNFYESLRIHSHSDYSTGRRSILAHGFVAVELGICIASLAVTAILSQTLVTYTSFSTGIDRDHLVSIDVDFGATTLSASGQQKTAFRITDSLQSLPNVISSSTSSCALFTNCIGMISLQAAPNFSDPVRRSTAVQRVFVGAKYFRTLGTSILQGRDIGINDTASSEPVAVVNAAFVKHFLMDGAGVGSVFKTGGRAYKIVGIVADARMNTLYQSAPPMVFFPLTQHPLNQISSVEVRVSRLTAGAMYSIRRVVHAQAPTLPLLDVVPVKGQIDHDLSREMVVTKVAGTFSILALFVAVLGLYTSLAYSVSKRASEFGVRLALGATSSSIIKQVVREAAKTYCAGCCIGLVLAIPAIRLMGSLIYKGATSDVLPYIGVWAISAGCALLASAVPVWRASRINPISLLRS